MPKRKGESKLESGGVAVADNPVGEARRTSRRGRPRKEDLVAPVINEEIMVIPREKMKTPAPSLEENKKEELIIPSIERSPKPVMVIPQEEMKSAPPMSEADAERIFRMGQIRNDLKGREKEAFEGRGGPSSGSSTVDLGSPGRFEKEEINNESNVFERISKKISDFFKSLSYRPPRRPDLN
jgi:hypothetical protein